MRRLIYRGSLRFPHGYHTGTGQSLDASDHPMRLDARGRAEVAGTSLAGVLRADLEKLIAGVGGSGGCRQLPGCPCPVCDLLGSWTRPERSQDPALAAKPSRLFMRTATSKDRARPKIRDRVGIDRRTRTAAAGRKFDLEVLEEAGDLGFELRIDQATELDKALLEQTLFRLAQGWLFLGGKNASGFGQARLDHLERHELDLGDSEALVTHLLGESPTAGASTIALARGGTWNASVPGFAKELPYPLPAGEPAEEDPESEPGAPEWAQLRLGLELEFPFGLLVHDPAEALLSAHHHAFLRDEKGRPVLPGSSLRGVLRSRAERILRSFGGERAACHLHDKKENCLGRLEKEKKRREKKLPVLTPQQERARLCLACQVFGCGHLASAVKVGEMRTREELHGEPRTQEHLAIDRFTGAAAEGLKFDAEHSPKAILEGELHLEIGPFRLEPWGLGLLVLVLRDLFDGDIPLGFGSGRGNNVYRARLRGLQRFWLQCPEDLAPFDAAAGRAGQACWQPPRALGIPGLRGLAGPKIRRAAESWVEALHAAIDQLETWEETSKSAGLGDPAAPEGDEPEIEESTGGQEARTTSEPRNQKDSDRKKRQDFQGPGAPKPSFSLQRSSRELAAVPLENLDQALGALAGDGSAWGFRSLPDQAMLKHLSLARWREELGTERLLEARIFNETLDLHWLGDRGLLLVDPARATTGQATVGGSGWLERKRRSRLWGEWLEGTDAWYEARIPDPLCYEGLTPGPDHCVPFLRYRELIRGGGGEKIVQYLGVDGEPRKGSES